jgi:hypothetical protein
VPIRRTTVLAMSIVAILGPAGCASAPAGTRWVGGPAPSPSRVLAPHDAVLAAERTLLGTTFHSTLSWDEVSGTSVVDPVGMRWSMSATVHIASVDLDVHVTEILIGSDLWMKFDVPGLSHVPGFPAGYQHISPQRLSASASLRADLADPDPAGGPAILNNLANVEHADPLRYTATVDLTKVTDPLPGAQAVHAMGDKAKAVPVEITIDDRGRLVEVRLGLAAVTNHSSPRITYSDFGAPVTIDPPPAGQTSEAPASLYNLLNKG